MLDAQEEQIGQEAAKHILCSSWPRRKTMGTTKKRKNRNSDGPDSKVVAADTSIQRGRTHFRARSLLLALLPFWSLSDTGHSMGQRPPRSGSWGMTW